MAEDDDIEFGEEAEEPGIYADADIGDEDEEEDEGGVILQQGDEEDQRITQQPILTLLPTSVKKAEPIIVAPNQRRINLPLSAAERASVVGKRARALQEGANVRLPMQQAVQLRDPVRIAWEELDNGLLTEYQILRGDGGRLEAWYVNELLSKPRQNINPLVSRSF